MTEPTARRIKAGALLANGSAKTVGQALVRSGYSPATARNPTENGLDAATLLRAAARAGAGEDALKALREPALEALRTLIEDPDTPLGCWAPAALGALKLISDAGLNEDLDEASSDGWRTTLRRAVRLGIALGQGRRILGFDVKAHMR